MLLRRLLAIGFVAALLLACICSGLLLRKHPTWLTPEIHGKLFFEDEIGGFARVTLTNDSGNVIEAFINSDGQFSIPASKEERRSSFGDSYLISELNFRADGYKSVRHEIGIGGGDKSATRPPLQLYFTIYAALNESERESKIQLTRRLRSKR